MDSCLQETRDEIIGTTDGMSAEQLAWHPAGKWSAGEILEHLTLAFSGTVKGMHRILASTGGNTPRVTMKNLVATFVVTGIGYMPPGRQAPAMTVPKGSNADNPVAIILRTLGEMDAALSQVEREKGPKIRVAHPILGPLTIAQWRKFHLVHTKHHMKQIVRLRELAS